MTLRAKKKKTVIYCHLSKHVILRGSYVIHPGTSLWVGCMEMEPIPSVAHNLPPWKPNNRTKLKWLITQDGKETIWQRIICVWLEIKAVDSQTEVQHKNKLFYMPRGWYILPVSQIFIYLRELQAATSLTCKLHNNQTISAATSHTCNTLLEILIHSLRNESMIRQKNVQLFTDSIFG